VPIGHISSVGTSGGPLCETGSAGPEPWGKALNAPVARHQSGDATVAWVDQIGFEQTVLKVRRLPSGRAPGLVFHPQVDAR
jgi:hypothetical protein